MMRARDLEFNGWCMQASTTLRTFKSPKVCGQAGNPEHLKCMVGTRAEHSWGLGGLKGGGLQVSVPNTPAKKRCKLCMMAKTSLHELHFVLVWKSFLRFFLRYHPGSQQAACACSQESWFFGFCCSTGSHSRLPRS